MACLKQTLRVCFKQDDLELVAYQRPGLLLQSAYVEFQTGRPEQALALLQESGS